MVTLFEKEKSSLFTMAEMDFLVEEKRKREERRKILFDKIERSIDCDLTDPIRNILSLQNVDQASIIAGLTPKSIEALEKYARTEAYKQHVSDWNDIHERMKYYGDWYADDAYTKFEFSEGEKIAIDLMIDHCKKNKNRYKRLRTSSENKEKNSTGRETVPTAINTPTGIDFSFEISDVRQRLSNTKSELPSHAREKLNMAVRDMNIEVSIVNGQRCATLSCVLCDTLIKISKLSGNWQITNYVRHLKTHSQATGQETRSRRKRKSESPPEPFIDIMSLDSRSEPENTTYVPSPSSANLNEVQRFTGPATSQQFSEAHSPSESYLSANVVEEVPLSIESPHLSAAPVNSVIQQYDTPPTPQAIIRSSSLLGNNFYRPYSLDNDPADFSPMSQSSPSFSYNANHPVDYAMGTLQNLS